MLWFWLVAQLGRVLAAMENHTWDRLHKGWKRRRYVMETIRKWLAGKGLDVREDSAIVKN